MGMFQKTLRIAKELGYVLKRLPRPRRRHLRVIMDVGAEILLRQAPTRKVLDRGTARLWNISPGGALITDIMLSRQSLPLQPFVLELRIPEGRLAGLTMTCRVVRFETDKRVFLGLSTEQIARHDSRRLEALFRKAPE